MFFFVLLLLDIFNSKSFFFNFDFNLDFFFGIFPIIKKYISFDLIYYGLVIVALLI